MAKSSRSSTATRRATAKPLRASEWEGLQLDVGTEALRDLMTEQSRRAWGWSCFYVGTRAELTHAGIPVDLFPVRNKRTAIRVNGQSAYLQQHPGNTFELELQFTQGLPRQSGATHPALAELARMVLCEVSWWLDSGERVDGYRETDEIAVRKLIECKAAVDYRLPSTKRFKFAPGEKERILDLAQAIYLAIQTAEVVPIEPAILATVAPADGKIIDMKQACAERHRSGKRAIGARLL